MTRWIFLLILIPVSHLLYAQGGSVNTWKVHQPYQDARSISTDGKTVYVGGPSGIFTYNIQDRSLATLSKINGLSQQAVSVLKYNTELKLLMVVYENTDIDLIKDGYIINIPDILRKTVIGIKRINHIYFNGDLAYLSGTLGVIIVDLRKLEIKDSYTDIGPGGDRVEIFNATIYDKFLYASTADGILRAPVDSPNLADYKYWSYFISSKRSRLLATYKNKLYAEVDSVLKVYDGNTWTLLRDNTSRRNYSIESSFGNLVACQQDATTIIWDDGTLYTPFVAEPIAAVTDPNRQIYYLYFGNTGLNTINTFTGAFTGNIYPNGPKSSTAADFAMNGSEVWVAAGNGRNFSRAYNPGRFYRYSNNTWTNYVDLNPAGLDTIADVVCIAYNSNTNKVFLGSFGRGLYEYDQQSNTAKVYDPGNSTLRRPPNDVNQPLNVSGLKTDKDGNLWVSNYGATNPLSVYTKAGQWKSFNFGSLLNSQTPLTDIDIDREGRKWIVAVRQNGVLVFDDNNTIDDISDDKARLLRQGGGNGGLPSNDVMCLAVDREGEVWIGTQAGLTVFFSPSDVFEGADASQIIIGSGSNAAYLLGTEFINCITVDGGNRKWVGTRNGLWLIAPDGMQVLKYFNESNSPLISNNVLEVGVNPVSGEVLLATEKGLMSYFGDATDASDKHSGVSIYPNPVRPGYEGIIAIRGLPEKANVKITDINGVLIYETNANGGMATWNGRNFNGDKVATGVYLVFSSNKDGSDTMTNKILFVN